MQTLTLTISGKATEQLVELLHHAAFRPNADLFLQVFDQAPHIYLGTQENDRSESNADSDASRG